jgi:H+/Cl- antiporter ClcA
LASAGTLKFGSFQDVEMVPVTAIHAPLFIGIFCGALGALFVHVQQILGKLRKKYMTSNPMRIVETALFGAMTFSAAVFAIYAFDTCESIPNSDLDNNDAGKSLV